MNFTGLTALILSIILFISPCYAQDAANNTEKEQLNKELFYNFSFQELINLSKTNKPEGILKEKLDFILNNPIVDNSISQSENIKFQEDNKIGKFIRVASWNINRGFNLDSIELLFTDTDKLLKNAKNKNEAYLKHLKEQAEILKNVDILVLNEVDVGMPRTKYKNVVEEFARILGFNYVYGLEFLEVDPVHLGLEDYKWSEERFIFGDKKIEIDQQRYKGMHGTAILSRFPVKNCRIIRLPNAYNWFNGEKKRISELEIVKRHAAEKIFREEMIREIRQGSRIAVAADVEIPGLDTPVTVVAVHLENRSLPKGRQNQIKTLLKELKEVGNPIIMAGDFNTTTGDGAPTSVTREISKKIKDPEFVARSVLSYAIPPAAMINSAIYATNFARKFTDPTVKNIPIIAPNKERALFEKLKKSEFKDHHNFDFRGTKGRTIQGWNGMLGNSNERYIKGFVPTYIFERPLHVGKYKLDWIFVKAYLEHPTDKKGPYKLAPHYGRTLFDLNYAFEKSLSDHVPITVDLPLEEPKKPVKVKKSEKQKMNNKKKDKESEKVKNEEPKQEESIQEQTPPEQVKDIILN